MDHQLLPQLTSINYDFNFCYPDTIFQNLDSLIEFHCPINHGILCNPVTDECPQGHTFCAQCISLWQKNHTYCPISHCMLKVHPAPLIVKNFLNTQKVVCVYEKLGCKWTGTLEQLESHIKNDCDHCLIYCENDGCNKELERRFYSEHQKECPWREIQCYICGEIIRSKDWEQHKNQFDFAKFQIVNKKIQTLEKKLLQLSKENKKLVSPFQIPSSNQ